MAQQKVQLIYTDNPGNLPADFTLPPGLDLELSSVIARVNGSGAAATFLPVLEVLSQDGKIIAQSRPDQEFSAGDTGRVTWAPFLRRQAAAAAGGLPDAHSSRCFGWAGSAIVSGVLTDLNTGWTGTGDESTPPPFDATATGIVVSQHTVAVVSVFAQFAAAFAGQRYLKLSAAAGTGTITLAQASQPVLVEGSDPGLSILLTAVISCDPSAGALKLVPEIFQASGVNQALDANVGAGIRVALPGV